MALYISVCMCARACVGRMCVYVARLCACVHVS